MRLRTQCPAVFCSHISPVSRSLTVPSPLFTKREPEQPLVSNMQPAPHLITPAAKPSDAHVCPFKLDWSHCSPMSTTPLPHIGNIPPASVTPRALVPWLRNACTVASSPLDGHMPPASVSACDHFVEYFASHLLKSGIPPLFAA